MKITRLIGLATTTQNGTILTDGHNGTMPTNGNHNGTIPTDNQNGTISTKNSQNKIMQEDDIQNGTIQENDNGQSFNKMTQINENTINGTSQLSSDDFFTVNKFCCKTLHEIINDESFKRKITQEDISETYSFFLSTLRNHPDNVKLQSKKPAGFHVEKLVESLDFLNKKEKISKCREDLLKIFGLLSFLRIRTLREILHCFQGRKYAIEKIIDALIEINGCHVTKMNDLANVKSNDKYLYLHLSISLDAFTLKLEEEYELNSNVIREISEAIRRISDWNGNSLMKRDLRMQLNKAMILSYLMIKEVFGISDIIKTEF